MTALVSLIFIALLIVKLQIFPYTCIHTYRYNTGFTRSIMFINLCTSSAANTCRVPDLQILSKFKTFLHKDWLLIGFSLGISQQHLNKINKDQARSQEKCHAVFEKWLQVDSSPCYCKLTSAVTSEHSMDVAEFIKFSVGANKGIRIWLAG